MRDTSESEPNGGAPAYRVLVVDDAPEGNALVAYHLAPCGVRATASGGRGPAAGSAPDDGSVGCHRR